MRYCAVLGAVVAGACDTGIKPTATIAAPDSADQVLFGMSHYVMDAGIQRAHVRADTAYFYSPAQTAELRNVHITFYDTRGAETSTLTSRQGTYHWRSGDMEARGNVVVVRTDGGARAASSRSRTNDGNRTRVRRRSTATRDSRRHRRRAPLHC